MKGLEIAYNSLEAQEDICKGFIERHEAEGWKHVQTYCDAGLSGGTTERPALQQMLQDARDGKLDCVVVFKLDRLARNHRDFVNLLADLGELRVDVASVTENFDCRGPLGRAIRHFLGVFAEMERSFIRERCRERAEAARMRGIFLGSRPPFGYRKEAGRLVVDDKQAETVRRMFRLYAGGMGSVQLAAELNRRGELRVGRGNEPPRPWNSRTVLHALRNPVYVGCIRGSGAELHPGLQRSLVGKGVWQQVQQRLAENAAVVRKRMTPAEIQVQYPLRGLLVCVGCGRRMGCYHQQRHGRRYYVCNTRRKHGPGSCASFSLNADKVEPLLLDLFRCIPERQRERLEQAAGCTSQSCLAERLRRVFREVVYRATDGVLILRLIPRAEVELNLPVTGCAGEYELPLRAPSPPGGRKLLRRGERPTPRAICLANALRIEELLGAGVFSSPADMARALGLSRSLIYDRLSLLNLPPAEIERVLFEVH